MQTPLGTARFSVRGASLVVVVLSVMSIAGGSTVYDPLYPNAAAIGSPDVKGNLGITTTMVDGPVTRAAAAAVNPYERRPDCVTIGGALLATGTGTLVFGVAQGLVPGVAALRHGESCGLAALLTGVGLMTGAFQMAHGANLLKISITEWRLADAWDRCNRPDAAYGASLSFPVGTRHGATSR